MNIATSIDQLIGNTPLMRLTRLEQKLGLQGQLLAKLEYFNPGGSIKDRAALQMLRAAEQAGRIGPGALIIEPTSGNTGIGLACAKKLAEHGAKVYLAVRNLEAGKKVAGEIIAVGGQADVVYFDAGKEETFGSMVDEVVAKEGRIDILVNVAGVQITKLLVDTTKADYDRIFKSEIITDLIRVLGCGVEIQNKHVKDLAAFDLNNLRWNKVVICTDGDVDGFQIRTLILTMLYRLCPTLIREGYVYIAETPLFEITYKEKSAEKTWFAYSEKEKADIVRQLEGKKFTVQRSKGLGENDPEMMWLTTMNPETRRLVRVLPDEAEETARVFDLLLGDNLSGRKDYIAENGCRYLDMIDVS